MAEDVYSSVSGFVDEVDSSEKTLLLLNRQEPEPVTDLLSRAFERQSVTVAERHLPEGTNDLVCLVDDGEVVAVTPLSALEETFLLVNADRYRTGIRRVDADQFPDVLTGLTDVAFTVQGYPASNKEKLLLVLVSRFVEYRALAHGAGELHSSFQQLSRLDNEHGTRAVYERLADSGVDAHIYGVRDDPTVAADLDVTVHSGRTDAYRRSWVVVFVPEDADTSAAGGREGCVALVATETDENVWRGMWTFDADRVRRIQSFVRRQF